MITSSTKVSHIGVGIDTARYGHRVTFLREDRQPAAPPITITENDQGFQQLKEQFQRLLQKHPQVHFHVHLDAAGQYATNLERFLRQLEFPITLSIGEPKRNKDYHKAFSPKRTTDDTESHAMARFGVVEQPRPTPEVPDEFYALREIVSRLQGQIRDTTRATNRLHNVLTRVFPELATLVNNLASDWLIQLLKKYPTPQRMATARLSSLEKIPYLNPTVAQQLRAAVLVSKMIAIERFESAEKLVGYFGVFPEENSSGVDRLGHKLPPGTMRMSAKGSDLVRRYLWNAAKSAIQHNTAVRDLYARLRAKGTRGDVAMGHCMRKLLHHVFAVWASNTPFVLGKELVVQSTMPGCESKSRWNRCWTSWATRMACAAVAPNAAELVPSTPRTEKGARALRSI